MAKKPKARRGRPAAPKPPPGSPQGNAGFHALFTVADFDALAAASGLSPALAEDALAAAADAINDALNDFALWSAVRDRDAAAAAKRDWCGALARTCGDMLTLMGSKAPDRGQAFRDGMSALHKGWPVAAEDEPCPALFELSRALARAAPDKWTPGIAWDGAGATGLWWDVMRRLVPTLALVESVARRAEAAWAAEVRRGGKDRDAARCALFQELARIFGRLFGHPPGIKWGAIEAPEAKRDFVPAGPDFEWFSALLRVAERRARDAIRRNAPAADLAPLVDLAKRGNRKGRDALAHWIREGADDACGSVVEMHD
jgi:hypothetical protein